MMNQQAVRSSYGWRIWGTFGGGFAALFILFFVSLCYGAAPLSVSTVIDALVHRQDILEHNMIWTIRMPRTMMGVLAGGALAVAGALLQTITRNPLAASDTLGINAGAYFVVILGTVLFPTILHQAPFLFAATGGLIAAILTYFLGGGRTASPIRLALAGMIVSMVIGSFTSALHIFFAFKTQGLFIWGSGSLIQNDWSGVQYSWIWIVVLSIIAFVLSRQFDVLDLDDATASSLGHRVGLIRSLGIILSVLLAAIIVSVIGPIGFVGLVAPHLVRLMGLRKHHWLIPGSLLWGAVLVLTADVLSRMIHNDNGEMPTGAMMALIGAPWLIVLVLWKMKANASSGQSSMQIGKRHVRLPYSLLATIFIIGTLVLIVISTAFGGTYIPISELFRSLFGNTDSMYSILFQLRLPRTFVAVGAGIALAVSGVLIQSAVRNPLADASVIGVSSGAGFGALAVLILLPGLPDYVLPLAAIAGASIAAAIVFILAWRRALNPSVLILLGIAVSAMAGAGIQTLIIRGAIWGSSGYIWLTGSTYGRGWTQVIIIVCFLVVLLPIAWLMARRFDLLVFDDHSAIGLGLPVRGTRLMAMITGVLLTGGAVACVGTIGFLGLMAPHMVRMLIGNQTRHSIVLSGALGALLLVLADTIGRTVIAPTELPSGLLISLIGAPYFLFLMYQSNWRRNKA